MTDQLDNEHPKPEGERELAALQCLSSEELRLLIAEVEAAIIRYDRPDLKVHSD
jgi:hypothetical protein